MFAVLCVRVRCWCLKPSGPIENTLCEYETLERVNTDLYDTLHDLVKTPFFRYYKVRLSPFHLSGLRSTAQAVGTRAGSDRAELIIELWFELTPKFA